MRSSVADVAIVVPVFNERANLPVLIEHLQQFTEAEFVLVDGGSSDGSWEWLQQNAPNRAVQSDLGRAKQMNVGAAKTVAKNLLFLHADTRLPGVAIDEVIRALDSHLWGRFNVAFFDGDWRMRIIAKMMNWRSAGTGVATGDQALFMRREIFEKIDGFPILPLMEDVALSKSLRTRAWPFCSRVCVQTSARRWLQHGVVKTVLLMWAFRLAYFFGVSPQRLADYYRQVR